MVKRSCQWQNSTYQGALSCFQMQNQFGGLNFGGGGLNAFGAPQTGAAAPVMPPVLSQPPQQPAAASSSAANDILGLFWASCGLVIDFHPPEDFSAPQVMTRDSLQICVEDSSSVIRFGTRFSRRGTNQKRNLVSKMMSQRALCSTLFKHPSGQFLWHFQWNFETRLWVDKAQAWETLMLYDLSFHHVILLGQAPELRGHVNWTC